MATEEQVMTLFKEANPIPDLEALDLEGLGAAGYLAALHDRETTKPVTASAIPPTRERRWSPVLAGIIAITIITVWAVFYLSFGPQPGDSTPTIATTRATPDPTLAPEEVARRWLECSFGGCAAQVDDLAVSGLIMSSGQTAMEYMEFRRLIGTEIGPVLCEPGEPVRCQVTGSDAVREIFGFEFTEQWDVMVRDGRVAAITGWTVDDQETIDAYTAWLGATYPDEMAVEDPGAWAAAWTSHAEEFRESDDWVPPVDIDIVGEWRMLKGETWTFSDSGIYTVANQKGVYETGDYTFVDGIITITATDSETCPIGTGRYELRFFSSDRLGWLLIDDECGVRERLLNGSADRVG